MAVLAAAASATAGLVLAVGTLRDAAPQARTPEPAAATGCMAPAAGASAGHVHAFANAPPPGGGLDPTADGFSLRLDRAELSAGTGTPLRLRVLDGAGKPARLVPTAGVALHTYLVSGDLQVYQHLHPAPDAGCDWLLTANPPRPGPYRLFTVFQPQQRPADAPDVVLSRPVTVTGTAAAPAPAAPEGRDGEQSVAVVDGYRLALRGYVTPRTESLVSVDVSRDGRPVRTLQPYLGAMAHVSVFRDGDLAFSHAHPVQPLTSTGGPTLTLPMILPGAGRYRMFVQVNADGAVRTAGFTLTVR